jgi:hypothetical protein
MQRSSLPPDILSRTAHSLARWREFQLPLLGLGFLTNISGVRPDSHAWVMASLESLNVDSDPMLIRSCAMPSGPIAKTITHPGFGHE